MVEWDLSEELLRRGVVMPGRARIARRGRHAGLLEQPRSEPMPQIESESGANDAQQIGRHGADARAEPPAERTTHEGAENGKQSGHCSGAGIHMDINTIASRLARISHPGWAGIRVCATAAHAREMVHRLVITVTRGVNPDHPVLRSPVGRTPRMHGGEQTS